MAFSLSETLVIKARVEEKTGSNARPKLQSDLKAIFVPSFC